MSTPLGVFERGNLIENIGNNPADGNVDGISVVNVAFANGQLEQANTITIGHNTILGSVGAYLPDDAIELDNQAIAGGTINQTANIEGNTPSVSPPTTVFRRTTSTLASSGRSSINQTLNITGNTSNDNLDDGIDVNNEIVSAQYRDIIVPVGRLLRRDHPGDPRRRQHRVAQR